MLQRALRDHNTAQQQNRAKAERLRKDALSTVTALTDATTDVLNYRVREVFANQRLLEGEAKQLQAVSARYAKQTSQWLAMIETFNNSLKELGDVQSWAQSIENDMHTIASALEYVHQGAPNPGGEGERAGGGDE